MVRDSTMTRETPKTATTTSTTARVDWIRRRLTLRPSALLEAEADSADRGDEPRVRRVVAELLAQPGDVHVEGLRRGPPGGVPDLAHQLIPRDDPARVPHQHPQQIELLGGQLEFLLAHPGSV